MRSLLSLLNYAGTVITDVYTGNDTRLGEVIASMPITYTQDLAASLPVVLQSKTGANAMKYMYALGMRSLAHAGAAWHSVGISVGGCARFGAADCGCGNTSIRRIND